MKVRLMGPSLEVAQALEVLRGCPRLELATVSELLPTRGGARGGRWVRAYIDATVAPHRTWQAAPCHGPVAAIWVGETPGPGGRVDLWACTECAATWTTSVQRPEAAR